MKKLLGFLFGFATIVMVFGAVYIVALIYNTSRRFVVEPYFLRTGTQSTDSLGLPRSLDDVGKRKLRDWLIQKYVTEYFYIIPDTENIAQRTVASYQSPMYMMSSPDVFEDWRQNVAADIQKNAENGVRRTVTVFNEIFKPESSIYWRVDYELKTWYNPNDMSEEPTITRGTMYLDLGDAEMVNHIGDVREPIEEVQKILQRGVDDPAIVFYFNVFKVLNEEK